MVLKAKQEMLNDDFSNAFLKAHNDFVQAVRSGKIKAPKVQLDYGTDQPNPYGVGASSLAGEARKWWYRRKASQLSVGSEDNAPYDYAYTAEQGRMMEVPVINALRQMGYTVEPQQEAKGEHTGGYVDGIITSPDNNFTDILEVKHLGASRYLEMWDEVITKANNDYAWQAWDYQEVLGLHSSLFVIVSQDASAVRKHITDDKRFRKIIREHVPNPKMFAFRLTHPVGEGNAHITMRAVGMLDSLKDSKPPARELDPSKDWQCMPAFCPFRAQCLTDGKDGKVIYQLPKVEVEKIWL